MLRGLWTQLDTGYGRSRGESINGTGVVAELFRGGGHEVRTARRLSEELDDWADVIVRFAPRPGPPEHDEARWYDEWLSHEIGPGDHLRPPRLRRARRLLVRRARGAPEGRPGGRADPCRRSFATRPGRLRDELERTPELAPSKAKAAAAPEDWFAVDDPKTNTPEVCKGLAGPWGRGLDAGRVALPRHATLKFPQEEALLTGDGRPLVIERDRPNDRRVLVVASGAFLLNASLINPARRPLALRVVDWAGESPRKVAFVEGRSVLGEGQPNTWPGGIPTHPPFPWVAAQMFALALAACLALAPRLGRPRPAPPSDADRPAAHAEALGSLLARTGQPEKATAALDAFRQWRKKAGGGGGGLE